MYTIEHRQEAYHRVLERLQSALQKEPDADEIYLDATIQRFELPISMMSLRHWRSIAR